MLSPSSNLQRIAFDRFEADLRSGELRKNGRRIRLQAQPFQLLALLLERPGEVLLATIWSRPRSLGNC
jgi:DNA-binding winged helix-turn-helix (wHTH) protein